ncbi:proton-conducting transporter membrane subunit [Isoptericola sp. NPDC057391]|uniref:proton-conducting transporter transmembrane domain-containing protein n=1 Tax=Isoptericola sp. NPDC057391 TaxID=3346117 RepID=UPI0036426D8A
MTWLLLVALAVPAVVAAALLTRATDGLVRAAPLALAPVVVVDLLGPVRGVALQLDLVGRPLLLFVGVLYAAALALTARSADARTASRSGLLLVAFVGTATVLVAADAVTFLAGCVATTVAAHRLILHPRTPRARRAARLYLVLAVASDVVLAVAVVLVVAAGGLRLADTPPAVAAAPTGGVIVGLLLLGFGIKAATFPLHGWLPIDEAAASVPVGAVLSGTVVKVGLVGWLRFLPLGHEALPGWGTVLVVVALVGAFGVLVPGVLTDDPEVSLAYSTVGQMGFLALVVGVALGAPDLAEACLLTAVVYAVHHGMAKGGLIMAVEVWERYGAGRARAVVAGGALVLALAITGAPLGSGAVAKYAAKRAVGEAPFLVDVTAVLPFVATVSTLLLVRAFVLLRASGHPGPAAPDAGLWSWAVLAVGGTIGTWALAWLWLSPEKVPGLDAVTAWGAAWPILLGLAVAGAVLGAARAGVLPAWTRTLRIPAGDLLDAVASRVDRRAERSAERAADARTRRDGGTIGRSTR